MRKIASIIALGVLFLVIAIPVLAENKELPKGLEDKGPLTKITFIHYKKNFAKPTQPGKPKDAACYGYLARGAKWKTTEGFEINPANSNLDNQFILNALTLGAEEWDSRVSFQIFGTGQIAPDSVYQTATPDEHNVVAFGTYSEPNVIAVTTIWGYFGGPPQYRELVEWDMLFNDGYQWGDAQANPALMDLQNIATHELGHSAGMDDIYTTDCSAVTMYGYSFEGDTAKRDLEPADITGITQLYQ